MRVKSFTPKGRSATVRLAMWSAQHPMLAFLVWFGIIFASIGLGQLKVDWANSSNQPAATEAERAYDVLHDAAAASQPAKTQAKVPSTPEPVMVVITHSSLKVSDFAFKAVVEDIASQLRVVRYTPEGVPATQSMGVGSSSAPASGPQLAFSKVEEYYSSGDAALVSADGTTTRILAVPASIPPYVAGEAAQPAITSIEAQHPDFTILTYNPYYNEYNKLLGDDLVRALILSLPITFVILLITFGALVATLIPLFMAGCAIVAAFSTLIFINNATGQGDDSVYHIVVLMGLAVGIDYALFLITRYRSELRRGRDKIDALEVAASTSGRAVFFSGLTVMISLAGLLFVNDKTFTSIAVGTIAVVFFTVIGSLTFLPATITILGDRINWGRIPYFGRDREEGSGLWSRLVSAIARAPLLSAATVVTLLLALSSPILHLNLGLTEQSYKALPQSMELRKVMELMATKWPQIATTGKLRLVVVVSADGAGRADVQAATAQLGSAILHLQGLSGSSKPEVIGTGRVEDLTFAMSGDAPDSANQDIVRKVRSELIPASFKNISGVQVLVTGNTAQVMDTVQLYADKLPWVIGFVVLLSFLLLMVVFHSLIIPLKAVLLNLLSTAAAYGVLVLVFQDGWGAAQMGFTPVGMIEGWLPLFLFAILFGLSMDYHLFVLTRIKEEKDKGIDTRQAVSRGISVTSGTVTSAAAIMVAVFAVFAAAQATEIRELGLGLAVAIFIDATLIRSILLPATMELLGEWNWWLPGFLGWLPRVEIEGKAALKGDDSHTSGSGLVSVEEHE